MLLPRQLQRVIVRVASMVQEVNVLIDVQRPPIVRIECERIVRTVWPCTRQRLIVKRSAAGAGRRIWRHELPVVGSAAVRTRRIRQEETAWEHVVLVPDLPVATVDPFVLALVADIGDLEDRPPWQRLRNGDIPVRGERSFVVPRQQTVDSSAILSNAGSAEEPGSPESIWLYPELVPAVWNVNASLRPRRGVALPESRPDSGIPRNQRAEPSFRFRIYRKPILREVRNRTVGKPCQTAARWVCSHATASQYCSELRLQAQSVHKHFDNSRRIPDLEALRRAIPLAYVIKAQAVVQGELAIRFERVLRIKRPLVELQVIRGE